MVKAKLEVVKTRWCGFVLFLFPRSKQPAVPKEAAPSHEMPEDAKPLEALTMSLDGYCKEQQHKNNQQNMKPRLWLLGMAQITKHIIHYYSIKLHIVMYLPPSHGRLACFAFPHVAAVPERLPLEFLNPWSKQRPQPQPKRTTAAFCSSFFQKVVFSHLEIQEPPEEARS